MSLQEKMFAEVESWVASGGLKTEFLEGKNYSEAKFNYWLAKWKANQMTSVDGFRELETNGWNEVKLGKVLEIEAPSGVKITVFA
jgi:hypothetical protein